MKRLPITAAIIVTLAAPTILAQNATLHARLKAGADAEAAIAAIKSRLARMHGIRHATVEVETGEACSDETERRRANGTP